MACDDKRFISRNELYSAGFTAYKINLLVKAGKLVPINRNYFENTEFTGELNEFSCVSAYAPRGVICLTSAAVYHNLTTSRPLQIDVAVNGPDRNLNKLMDYAGRLHCAKLLREYLEVMI